MAELGMKQPMIGVDGFYDPEFVGYGARGRQGPFRRIIKEEGNAKLTKLTADYNSAKFSDRSALTRRTLMTRRTSLLPLLAGGPQGSRRDRQGNTRYSVRRRHGHASFDSNGQTTLPVDLELREVKGGVWAAH